MFLQFRFLVINKQNYQLALFRYIDDTQSTLNIILVDNVYDTSDYRGIAIYSNSIRENRFYLGRYHGQRQRQYQQRGRLLGASKVSYIRYNLIYYYKVYFKQYTDIGVAINNIQTIRVVNSLYLRKIYIYNIGIQRYQYVRALEEIITIQGQYSI